MSNEQMKKLFEVEPLQTFEYRVIIGGRKGKGRLMPKLQAYNVGQVVSRGELAAAHRFSVPVEEVKVNLDSIAAISNIND